MTSKTSVLTALLWSLAIVPGWAMTEAAGRSAASGEITVLRQELDRLRAEVAELRAMVERLAAPVAVDAVADEGAAERTIRQESQPEAPELSATVALLQSQVAELAQVKVESTSKLPVKVFGTIHSSTFVNSGEANWLDNPNIVQPGPPAGDPEGSFSSTLRQSRVGVTVDGLRVGSLRASGLLAFDFLGGAPAFQTGTAMGLPRLIYGFARIESDATALEIGQDEMVLAPRDPTSLAAFGFPALFRSGNLYLRVPQIRVEHRVATGSGSAVRLTAAIVAPLAGDFSAPYTFAPPAGAGERSRMPAFQGRVGWNAGTETSARRVTLGVSGHYGRQRLETGTRESWAGAVDLDVTLGRVGAGGEFYTGDRLGASGGSLGQQARSTGGFVEGRLDAFERLKFVAGFGIDQVADEDRPRLPLEENRSWFGNAIYRFTPELAGSIEYRWLQTAAAGAERRNQHVNWALAFSF